MIQTLDGNPLSPDARKRYRKTRFHDDPATSDFHAEMTEHLGHDKHATVSNLTGNARNGKSSKKLKGEFGELPIEIPRDRHGSFEPQLIPKHQTRWNGFDEKILSLYARGMTVREIQSHLTEMYGTEVSPTLISTVTDAVIDEVLLETVELVEQIALSVFEEHDGFAFGLDARTEFIEPFPVRPLLDSPTR